MDTQAAIPAPVTPPPATAPAIPAPTPPTSASKPVVPPDCDPIACAKCLKGGMPIKKEALTFYLILCIIISTVLAALYINALRQLKQATMTSSGAVTQSAQNAASPSAYPLPAASTYSKLIPLPTPSLTGKMSLETAIATRRSIRAYTSDPVTLAQLSQMLWSGQGQTDPSGKRTAPSSRESYSMTLFAVVQDVTGVDDGVYEYVPKTHSLGLIKTGDTAAMLKESGVEATVLPAPVVFVLTSSFGTYQAKTKSTNMSGTYMEAGHIGQNMYLQAQSLQMGMVVTGGFDTKKVTTALGIDGAQTVEYVIPFGKPAPVTPEK